MTHSSQPTPSASHGYPWYGPPWPGYDLHQGGYGRSQMFPSSTDSRTRPIMSRCTESAFRTAGNHPVNWPTLSSSNPQPERPSGADRRPLISLPTKRFQPPAEPQQTDVARIAELPPLQEMSYDDYHADDESDDS
jgi:hypothetical protein